MAHPAIYFSLNNNGSDTYILPAGSLKQRITGILGKKYQEKIAPVKEETDFLRIHGFIGKPEFSKKTRGEQFFFVNDRFIKSPYLNHAVMGAYNRLIPKDVYPFYAIFIDVDPKRIDVNIHPTKQEIKFDDEKVVYTFINAGVRHSLGLFGNLPTIDFEQEASFNQHPMSSGKSKETLSSQFDGGHFANKGIVKDWSQAPPKQSGVVKNWQDLYEIGKTDIPQNTEAPQTVTVKSKLNDSLENPANIDMQLFDYTGLEPVQLHQKFILTQIRSGMVLIDQHAAHVRILYERLIQKMAGNQSATQQLLFPKTLNFNVADAQLLQDILPDVIAFGFDIKSSGDNSFVVHGIPADLKNSNEQQLIENILEQYKQNVDQPNFDKRTGLAKCIAHQSAIKTGTLLNKTEMLTIIDELFACEVPYISPTGRLTFITLGLDMLEQQFLNKVS